MAHLLHQGHQVLPEGRFSASQPELVKSHAGKEADQSKEFVIMEGVLLGPEGHVLGHAIDAAEIAQVGERNPHVIYIPSVFV
jgi:hypothetical protein